MATPILSTAGIERVNYRGTAGTRHSIFSALSPCLLYPTTSARNITKNHGIIDVLPHAYRVSTACALGVVWCGIMCQRRFCVLLKIMVKNVVYIAVWALFARAAGSSYGAAACCCTAAALAMALRRSTCLLPRRNLLDQLGLRAAERR